MSLSPVRRRSRQEDHQQNRNAHGTHDDHPHFRKNNGENRGHQAAGPAGRHPKQVVHGDKAQNGIDRRPARASETIGYPIGTEDEQGGPPTSRRQAGTQHRPPAQAERGVEAGYAWRCREAARRKGEVKDRGRETDAGRSIQGPPPAGEGRRSSIGIPGSRRWHRRTHRRIGGRRSPSGDTSFPRLFGTIMSGRCRLQPLERWSGNLTWPVASNRRRVGRRT